MNFDNFQKDDFYQKLALASSNSKPSPKSLSTNNASQRKASVLIALFHRNNSWNIIFIKRAEIQGDIHSGQVSLPGGGKENVDKNAVDTALRETSEEIGILSNEVEILGEMPPYPTISNYLVTPVIGITKWPSKAIISENEVERIFSIPINWLSIKNNWTTKKREIRKNLFEEVIYYDLYNNELLWGATANIIVDFISILK